jgi:hypothetical protein
MTGGRIIGALAVADFRERSRRYSFLVTLLFTVYLGYAAARGDISLRLGDYRGLYTSAWVGAMMSLIVTTFLSLVGFYMVKNAVERDRRTGVGEILASTPLSRAAYLLGKFLSNFAVLASLVVVLAVAAIAMQFIVGEDRTFHAWALLSPFLLLSLPAMAVTAAIAVIFESVRWLRGGFGNIAWFFLWGTSIGLPGALKIPQCDPFGLWTVFESIAPAARAQIPGYKESFSLTIADKSARVFPGFAWPGIDWTPEKILWRIGWVAVAFAIVLLAVLFFDRFDPARSSAGAARKKKGKAAAAKKEAGSPETVPRISPPTPLTPLAGEARGGGFGRIFIAELRLEVQGYRWWWYAVATGLVIAQLASPLDVARGPLLTAAWIWPVLMWSAMGMRETRFGTRQLLFSCARVVPRQLPASWLAGVAIAALAGIGTGIRLAIAGQFTALLAWAAGALFVASLALALGVWTGSSRFFEGLYTALWYVGPLNRVRGLDFTGAANGASAGRFALLYLLITAALLAAAFTRRARQLAAL